MSEKNKKMPRINRAKKSKNVTIKDVAAELGLSITTISRGLNGYADVSEKTRARIEKASKSLGYHPNRNAQRLVTQKTNVFAWVQSDNDLKFVDPHFTEVLAGVLHAARTSNYDVILSSDTHAHQIDVYSRYVRDNSVDGFIVDLPRSNDPRIAFLLEAGKPFVVHGRIENSNDYNWVDVDNFGIYFDLTSVLIANGHQEIGFINGDEQFFYARERREGALAALDVFGLPHDRLHIYNSMHPMGHAGHKLTTQALAEHSGISALLYSSALMAVEGQRALTEAGRRAGDNIAVATMDDQLNSLDLSPYAGRFSYARSSLQVAGSALIETLVSACEQPQVPLGKIIEHAFILAEGMEDAALHQNRDYLTDPASRPRTK